MKKHNESRRRFAKKIAYIAPAILTLKAQPSFASSGSDRNDGRGHDHRRPRGRHGNGHGNGYGHD